MIITTITVSRSISMGHRLASYDGLCSSMHGHNVRVEVEVQPHFDAFVDFKAIDQRLEALLKPYDHAMVLKYDDPLRAALREAKMRSIKTEEEPTTEFLALMWFTQLQFVITADKIQCNVVRVTVHETDKYSATVYIQALD